MKITTSNTPQCLPISIIIVRTHYHTLGGSNQHQCVIRKPRRPEASGGPAGRALSEALRGTGSLPFPGSRGSRGAVAMPPLKLTPLLPPSFPSKDPCEHTGPAWMPQSNLPISVSLIQSLQQGPLCHRTWPTHGIWGLGHRHLWGAAVHLLHCHLPWLYMAFFCLSLGDDSYVWVLDGTVRGLRRSVGSRVLLLPIWLRELFESLNLAKTGLTLLDIYCWLIVFF